MPKGSLVAKLEHKKGMSWGLKAHVLHKAGWTQKGGHWHKGSTRKGGKKK
jgi:hypothetical protein